MSRRVPATWCKLSRKVCRFKKCFMNFDTKSFIYLKHLSTVNVSQTPHRNQMKKSQLSIPFFCDLPNILTGLRDFMKIHLSVACFRNERIVKQEFENLPMKCIRPSGESFSKIRPKWDKFCRCFRIKLKQATVAYFSFSSQCTLFLFILF